jgi:zinc-ribbon domain
MFCPSCGAEVPPSLSYCNRCGAELNAKAHSAKPTATYPESLVWALVAVSVGGLAVLIGLIAVMKETLPFQEGLIIGFVGLAFLLLMAAESVFIWLLLRSRMESKEAGDKIKSPRPTLRDLDAPRGLPEPAISITENTTRTLEPSRSERHAE